MVYLLAKNLRTDDGFVQVQQTIEFVAGGRLSGVVDHDVVTFGLAGDFVGKLATAPDVDVLDGTAFLGDSFQLLLGQLLQTALIQLRISNEHQFVLMRRHHPPPSDYRPWTFHGRSVYACCLQASISRNEHMDTIDGNLYRLPRRRDVSKRRLPGAKSRAEASKKPRSQAGLNRKKS